MAPLSSGTEGTGRMVAMGAAEALMVVPFLADKEVVGGADFVQNTVYRG